MRVKVGTERRVSEVGNHCFIEERICLSVVVFQACMRLLYGVKCAIIVGTCVYAVMK